MSHIHEALEKAKKERKELPIGNSSVCTVEDSGIFKTVSVLDEEKAKAEVEKQGLSYSISPIVVSYHAPKSAVAEEYRIMRTNFLSLSQNGGIKYQIKSVVISSTNHKEGKSITAANLSVALAQDGQRKILLVDCDFRKPSIRRLMGVRPKHDIIGVLTKEVAFREAIIPTPIPFLDLMVVNSIPPNPAELIGSPGMRKLVASLRSMYDMIIYDTPPVMAVTDAVILGSQVDGIVMAVQASRTQRERIRDAEDLIRQAHANLLGFVLTDVKSYIPKYLNRYQYYSTYKYID